VEGWSIGKKGNTGIGWYDAFGPSDRPITEAIMPGLADDAEVPFARCPSSYGIEMYDFLGSSYWNFAYGDNSLGNEHQEPGAGSWVGDVGRITQVKQPSRFINYFETAAYDYLKVGDANGNIAKTYHAQASRYNSVFVDGHAKGSLQYFLDTPSSDEYTVDNTL
jgi:hypothetical protein